jgi:hypothetical protein
MAGKDWEAHKGPNIVAAIKEKSFIEGDADLVSGKGEEGHMRRVPVRL